MGTFQESLKKWFYTRNTNPTIDYTTRIPVLDAQGNPLGSQTPPAFFTGNVGLIGTSTTKMILAKDADAISGQTHPGVWICEGGKMLIVAKDQSTSMAWGTAGSGGTGYVNERGAAADMAGETKTQTLYANKGDMAIAAKYALEYAPAGMEADADYGTGKWWLPSIGEMLMIFSHIQEVDYCLSLIGGQPLSASGTRNYHTSTESSSAKFFQFRRNVYGGYAAIQSKTADGYVRPVTSIY